MDGVSHNRSNDPQDSQAKSTQNLMEWAPSGDASNNEVNHHSQI